MSLGHSVPLSARRARANKPLALCVVHEEPVL